MKKVFFILVSCLFVFACQKKSNEYYLDRGLEGFDKFRYVNDEFIHGFGVQKIAFFEKSDTLSFVLLLDKSIEPETVAKYNLGLYVFPKDRSLIKNNEENRDYLIWDSKPSLEQYGPFKYIIKDFPQPIKRIDSLAFFLYDRNGYNGVKGNVIRLKNISF